MHPDPDYCPVCAGRLPSGLYWCSDTCHRVWLVREFKLTDPELIAARRPRAVPVAVASPATPATPPVDTPVHRAEETRPCERFTPGMLARLLNRRRRAS